MSPSRSSYRCRALKEVEPRSVNACLSPYWLSCGSQQRNPSPLPYGTKFIVEKNKRTTFWEVSNRVFVVFVLSFSGTRGLRLCLIHYSSLLLVGVKHVFVNECWLKSTGYGAFGQWNSIFSPTNWDILTVSLPAYLTSHSGSHALIYPTVVPIVDHSVGFNVYVQVPHLYLRNACADTWEVYIFRRRHQAETPSFSATTPNICIGNHPLFLASSILLFETTASTCVLDPISSHSLGDLNLVPLFTGFFPYTWLPPNPGSAWTVYIPPVTTKAGLHTRVRNLIG